MLYVMTAFAHAYPNIKEIRITSVAQNVYWIQIVHEKKHAFVTNA